MADTRIREYKSLYQENTRITVSETREYENTRIQKYEDTRIQDQEKTRIRGYENVPSRLPYLNLIWYRVYKTFKVGQKPANRAIFKLIQSHF